MKGPGEYNALQLKFLCGIGYCPVGALSWEVKTTSGKLIVICDSAGVVTTFYMCSEVDAATLRDEIDFEFLGNRIGLLYLIQKLEPYFCRHDQINKTNHVVSSFIFYLLLYWFTFMVQYTRLDTCAIFASIISKLQDCSFNLGENLAVN
uniref:Uncharacterized protein isoform X1 n=1 Tax=Nicotiana tabacum TaxID=4097 RepID=A0A1S3Z392_TOBAC|nr:PREDICTED: uncharacterized protein LOC107782493 isoform X1 [Nicotiana tabacum]